MSSPPWPFTGRTQRRAGDRRLRHHRFKRQRIPNLRVRTGAQVGHKRRVMGDKVGGVLGVLGAVDKRLGPGLCDQLQQLARVQPVVVGRKDRPELGTREHQIDVLDAVLAEKPDAIPAPDPATAQKVPEPSRPIIQRRVVKAASRAALDIDHRRLGTKVHRRARGIVNSLSKAVRVRQADRGRGHRGITRHRRASKQNRHSPKLPNRLDCGCGKRSPGVRRSPSSGQSVCAGHWAWAKSRA
jgi:hypothetical protein